MYKRESITSHLPYVEEKNRDSFRRNSMNDSSYTCIIMSTTIRRPTSQKMSRIFSTNIKRNIILSESS